MTDDKKNMFSDLSDEELVEAYSQVGDPSAIEMLKAEERRRKALRESRLKGC